VSEMSVISRRTENTEATRRAVFDAAKALFVDHGFADTSLDEVVENARVTKGALYWHYKNKKALFRAVVEELNKQLSTVIAERALTGNDAWTCVLKGTDAFLDFCLDSAYQRIILLDGPAVLGREEWREIAERHGLGIIRSVLDVAMKEGILEPQPIDPLAHLLHGALHEGAVYIAEAKNTARARKEVGAAVIGLMEGLRRPAKRSRGSRS
jgi:AcrR family transcriptional regulator